MKEKAEEKEREGRKNPAKQRRDCITQSKQAQAEARAPSPAQGLFRLGKNQSSGTKVIDRSDLHTHIVNWMVRVRGRCNCYAPSSESNQINNNRPQPEPRRTRLKFKLRSALRLELFPLLGHVNFNLISVPSSSIPPPLSTHSTASMSNV